MARDFSKVKRIVVKIGSSSLTYNTTHKLNIDRIDLFEKNKLEYIVDGKRYNSIEGQMALDLRNGLIKDILVEIRKA